MSADARLAHPDIPGLTFLRDLGAGGYADVYLYEQAMTDQQVAVKVMSGDLSEDDVRRFTIEATTMAGLDHPYIVQVFGADIAGDGRPYLVMKYYPRPNLAVRANTDRLSVTEVLSIGIKIACAVETAHQAGVLHRDIKPANILTNKFGEPGLTDFGISTTAGDEGSDQAEGMSIPWAPPEVVYAGVVDARSDVYSLGATLWHLLVGRSPFEDPAGDNAALAITRRIKAQAPPRTDRPDVPASLERLLAQTLAKDPAHRPASALGLAKALQGIEIGERWNPTPLTLLADGLDQVGPGDVVARSRSDDPTDPGPAASNGADRTRMRSAQRVVAQPSPSSFAPPEPVASGTRTVRRSPGGSSDVSDRTVQRAPSPAPDGPGDVPVPKRRSGSRRAALVGVAAVAVVAVGVGVALSVGSGGKPSAGSAAVSVQTSTDQNPFGASAQPPGTPAVTGTVTASGVANFSWTYSDPQPGDNFRWRPVDGAWTVSASPSAQVPATAGQAVCIEAQVQRADGSSQSEVSDPGCAG